MSFEEEEFDPYQTLNVTPDATTEEIQDSFKKLSRTFHPDRNRNGSSLDSNTLNASRQQFEAITKAKDILCNSQTRAAYDSFGIAGIEMMQRNIYNEIKSLQIGKKYRSDDAVKHLLKYYLKQEARFELDKLISSNGHCEIGIDATSLYQEFVDLIFRHETIPQFISNIKNGIPTLQIVINEDEMDDDDEMEYSQSELMSLSVEDQVSIIQNALNSGDVTLLKNIPVQRQSVSPHLLSFLISLGFQYEYDENHTLVLSLTQYNDNQTYQNINIEWHTQWNRFIKFISAISFGLHTLSSRFTISRTIDSKTSIDVNLFCNLLEIFYNTNDTEEENAADLFENIFSEKSTQNKNNSYLYVIPELFSVTKNGFVWCYDLMKNILSFNGGYAGFDISFGVQRILFNDWLGISSIRIGKHPSFSCNILKNHSIKQWNFKIDVSPKTFIGLSCRHNRRMDENIGFYIGLQFDLINIIKLECGFNKLYDNKISDKEIVNEIDIKQTFGIEVSIKQGISIRFGYKRGPSQIQIPIKCTEEYSSLKQILLSFCIPIVTYYGYKLYYKQYLNKYKQNQITKNLNEKGLLLHNKRQFALQQQSIMMSESKKNKQIELNKNGLIILCAYYGDHVQSKLFDAIRKYKNLDRDESDDSDNENENENENEEIIIHHDMEEKEKEMKTDKETGKPPPLLFDIYGAHNQKQKENDKQKELNDEIMRKKKMEMNKYKIRLSEIDWLNIERELDELMRQNRSEDMHLLSFVNVRIVLQYMVNNNTSQLVLSSGDKSYLPGFYDCCPDTYGTKELFVIYRYQNQYKYVTVSDMFPLTLPNEQHIEWFNCRDYT